MPVFFRKHIQSSNTETSEISESDAENSQISDSSSSRIEKVEFGLVPELERVTSKYFDDAIMVGDSITEGIQLYSVMKNATVISHTGINVSTISTKAVIQSGKNKITIPEAIALHPEAKKIYILVGANGISWMSVETFIEEYGKFIDIVKSTLPNAIIYVQSIFPINEQLFKKNYSQDLTNKEIDEYNAAILELAKEKKVYYLDVAQDLKDANGALSSEATTDGMHIGSSYYEKWFNYLKRHAITTEGENNYD